MGIAEQGPREAIIVFDAVVGMIKVDVDVGQVVCDDEQRVAGLRHLYGPTYLIDRNLLGLIFGSLPFEK